MRLNIKELDRNGASWLLSPSTRLGTYVWQRNEFMHGLFRSGNHHWLCQNNVLEPFIIISLMVRRFYHRISITSETFLKTMFSKSLETSWNPHFIDIGGIHIVISELKIPKSQKAQRDLYRKSTLQPFSKGWQSTIDATLRELQMNFFCDSWKHVYFIQIRTPPLPAPELQLGIQALKVIDIVCMHAQVTVLRCVNSLLLDGSHCPERASGPALTIGVSNVAHPRLQVRALSGPTQVFDHSENDAAWPPHGINILCPRVGHISL